MHGNIVQFFKSRGGLFIVFVRLVKYVFFISIKQM